MSNNVITAKQCLSVRQNSGLFLNPDREYESPRLKEIAIKFEDLDDYEEEVLERFKISPK